MNRIDVHRIFRADTPVVGMIHLPPLPGAPGWEGSMEEIVRRALTDARLLEEGGVDAVLVENFGDVPYRPGDAAPETVAAVTRVAAAVVEETALAVGINVLRNDARAALGAAVATGARFVRVNVHAGTMFTDQGIVEGRAHQTLQVREALAARVAILADVLVKHAAPPSGVKAGNAARDLWHRGRADALLVSGTATGRPVGPDRLRRVAEAVPEAPVWAASGMTAATVGELFPLCDGMVVGSDFQRAGRPGAGVELDRVKSFMKAVERARR